MSPLSSIHCGEEEKEMEVEEVCEKVMEELIEEENFEGSTGGGGDGEV